MKLWVGTSGYSYKEWKGSFYPEELPDKDMLPFYASKLPAVEINNTFYRMPKDSVLQNWAEQVPAEFRFSLKASQKITHQKRLKDAGDETAYLLKTAKVMGERLGVILFQLPPYLRKDLQRLEEFLKLLGDNTRAAFEFRHETWFDEDVYGLLKQHHFALCVSEKDDESDTPFAATADWGYLRLRRQNYAAGELKNWAKRVRDQNWKEAFVFFKHEDEGAGPRLAAEFINLSKEG
jgi:uncharacterized protein YecE (DUF72 family)